MKSTNILAADRVLGGHLEEGSEPETEAETEPEPDPEPESVAVPHDQSAVGLDSKMRSDSDAKRVNFAQIRRIDVGGDADSEDEERSDLDVDEMDSAEIAELRRKRRQNGSMRVRISSPESVLEEIANRQILDQLVVGRASDSSLAPTDDEPVPDGPDEMDPEDIAEVLCWSAVRVEMVKDGDACFYSLQTLNMDSLSMCGPNHFQYARPPSPC